MPPRPCSNSAMQMESEIYRHGRKLAYYLLEPEDKSEGLLEIQVELEDPNDNFDPFILGIRHDSEDD